MATLANLNVLIGSDVSGLTRGLRTADKKTRGFSSAGSRYMKQFAKGTGGAVRKVVNLRSAIGVLAGSAGLGLLVARQLEAIDSTAKLADRVGETTEEIVGLQHAAELTGAGSERMGEAIQVLQKRLGQAKQGTGQAGRALENLGININDIVNQRPGEQMRMIAEAMEGVGSQAERNAITSDLFSRANQKLVNTLALGRDGLNEMSEEADRLGLSFSRVDAAQVEAANDAITRAQSSFSAVARTLTVQLAPYIEAVADRFTEAAAESNGFRDVVINSVEGAAKAVGFLGDMIRGIKVVIKTVEIGFAAFAEGMIHTVFTIIDGYRQLANLIPGIDIGPLETLGGVAREATKRTNELTGELNKLVTEPMPSENIDAFFNSVKSSAQGAAIEVANSKQNMAGTIMDSGGQPVNEEDKTKLEQMRESFMSEQELRQEQFEQKREFLLNANSQLFEDEAERQRLLEQLEANHQNRLNKIKYDGLSQEQKLVAAFKNGEYNIVAKTGQKMIGAIFGQNSKIVEITKKAGMAMTVISGFKSAAQSLANSGGFPWGVPAMLASLSKTGAMQSAISAVSMGSSGGGAPVGGGAAPASPAPSAPQTPQSIADQQEEEAGPQKQLVINMPDDDRPVSKGWVRDNLMPTIKDAQKDGYMLA